MKLPEGFRATLFAGEPDVVQPIAFTIDDRGRLWVVESYTYPKWSRDGQGRDRILILEDENGDGRFDQRKVFWDRGVNLSGIQLGFGGVWLCSTPNFVFLPDRNSDDRPDAPPEVLLDGWSLEAKHNVFNGLAWGPDGWLYGCNGITDTSHVGKPGTPDDDRVAFNCGVWRYHPTRHTFEVVANGTTNPWGLDFDDYGQMFITNCVIAHLWHVVPGVHFQRMHGQDFNPHLFGLMQSCADHIHWAGGAWQTSRGGAGAHGEAGGGHAHVGAMVYLGDNWPDEYRNSVLTCNLHGNRVNRDLLARHGSGYVARHGKDFLMANDTWFRGLALQYGPDGGVYISDWTDTGECHDYDEVHLATGRIYKVVWERGQESGARGQGEEVRDQRSEVRSQRSEVGKPNLKSEISNSKPSTLNPRPLTAGAQIDIGRLSDAALVGLQLHRNDWFVRHARRMLQERAAAGKLSRDVRPALLAMLREHADVTRRLRALWALQAIGAADEALLAELLESPEESLRGWAVQLELEDRAAAPQTLARFATLAESDPSPLVRLCLASALQRLGLEARWAIAGGLVSHAEDAQDANLPLMIWYGIEPLVAADPEHGASLLAGTQIPLLRQYIVRRIASPGPLVTVLKDPNDAAFQLDVLRGMHEAFKGSRQLAMPSGWPEISQRSQQSPNEEVRQKALTLSLIFGDSQAEATLRRMAADAGLAPPSRQAALDSLLQRRDAGLVPILHSLVRDPAIRSAAIRGLAAYDHPDTPAVVLKDYSSFSDQEKLDAVNTLAGREAYARALLDAVAEGRVSRADLGAFTIRQLAELQDPQITARLDSLWGAVRPTDKDKQAMIADYKRMLTSEFLKDADVRHGRAVFAKNCASCHVLFDDGRRVGPELTGSQRANLDYVLENLLDPNAAIGRDYQVTLIQTVDGRVITGIITAEDERSLTLLTQNESIIIPVGEIDARERSKVSMMPEGLLLKLSDDEVRDLVAYLASPAQVPLPQGAAGGD
jgi:putative membrane-bound dehydrogenase-like protein